MASNPKQQRDWMRSCPFQELLPLFEIPEIHWVCLQKEVSPSDRDAVASCKQLERVSLDDFAATAAQVSGIDLVISVDTSVAHLARALIVPVWILFAKASDWRWLLDHDDSPWHPSTRLFRQRQVVDGKEVVRHVSEELRKRVVSDELRAKLLLSIEHSSLNLVTCHCFTITSPSHWRRYGRQARAHYGNYRTGWFVSVGVAHLEGL